MNAGVAVRSASGRWSGASTRSSDIAVAISERVAPSATSASAARTVPVDPMRSRTTRKAYKRSCFWAATS